jgi:nucleoid-associated protein YgaU
MHANYAKEMAKQDLLNDEESAAEEEFAAAGKGAITLEGLCETTGLSMDQVQQVMKKAEDNFMHRVVGPKVGDTARNHVVLYGLTEHRNGQPGWKSGIDF